MDTLTIIGLIVSSSLFVATPLIFTALGGVFSERSGVVNIGLEGLMIIGAFTGIVFNLTFVDTFGEATPWLALAAGMAAGGILSMLHALASVTLRADQVVSGVAINFLALGVSLFLVKLMYDKGQTDFIGSRYSFIKRDIPFLSDIPVVGEVFFSNIAPPTYLAFLLAFASWFVLFKTPFGLHLRSVGEHPMAADTMGINVAKIRYIAVFISGVLGGLGGAVYAQSISLDFSHSTITGQGFMALAAMIFGKWHPLGAMGAAIFFGFAQSLSIVSSSIPFLDSLPSVYLQIAPYVLTILALAGFIGRADAPKASGTPYVKGSR